MIICNLLQRFAMRLGVFGAEDRLDDIVIGDLVFNFYEEKVSFEDTSSDSESAK